MNNKIVLGIVSIIAIFGFLTIVYMATNTSNSSATTVYPETTQVTETDHTKWSKDKKHVLTEYSDLQCPACGMFYKYMKENIDNDASITKNITFVYRHFPLQQHKHALPTAYAAEAAGKQGKFFEMVDFLFTKQTEWENSDNINEYLSNAATVLKLDTDKFAADMNSKEVKDRVQADAAMGNKVTVNSTPTFFLDGKKVEVSSLNDFKSLLQQTAKQ